LILFYIIINISIIITALLERGVKVRISLCCCTPVVSCANGKQTLKLEICLPYPQGFTIGIAEE
jgi:hypothetical protein